VNILDLVRTSSLVGRSNVTTGVMSVHTRVVGTITCHGARHVVVDSNSGVFAVELAADRKRGPHLHVCQRTGAEEHNSDCESVDAQHCDRSRC